MQPIGTWLPHLASAASDERLTSKRPNCHQLPISCPGRKPRHCQVTGKSPPSYRPVAAQLPQLPPNDCRLTIQQQPPRVIAGCS